MTAPRIYDNGGRTADRYLAVFADGGALALSQDCRAPNGVNMTLAPGEVVEGPHLGRRVHAHDLPAQVSAEIDAFYHEWYQD